MDVLATTEKGRWAPGVLEETMMWFLTLNVHCFLISALCEPDTKVDFLDNHLAVKFDHGWMNPAYEVNTAQQ